MLLEHMDALFPIRHAVLARLGFAGRFDSQTARSARFHTSAVAPAQADLFFGAALKLNIDPARITTRLVDQFDDGRRVRRSDSVFLDGGDWSRLIFPLDHARVHVELLQVCQARDRFRDTSRYRALARQLEDGERIRRGAAVLRSREDLDAYYGYCLGLVESIGRDGLHPRRDVGSAALPGHGGVRTWWQDRLERDVGVAIGSDGTLIHHGAGRHRLAVALGLGLKRIPVEVRLVHSEWLLGESSKRGMPPNLALSPALEACAG